MNPKPRRFPRGTAAATLGAGAAAAALLLAPAISNAASDEPDDTVEETTPEDTATTEELDSDASDPGADRVIIIPGGSGGPLHPGGPEGPGMPGRVDRGPGGVRLRLVDPELIAATIGIDVDVLAEELRNGSTIAEIAEANGVDPQAVIDALVAEYAERVTAWIAGEQSTPDEDDDTASTATTEA